MRQIDAGFTRGFAADVKLRTVLLVGCDELTQPPLNGDSDAQHIMGHAETPTNDLPRVLRFAGGTFGSTGFQLERKRQETLEEFLRFHLHRCERNAS